MHGPCPTFWIASATPRSRIASTRCMRRMPASSTRRSIVPRRRRSRGMKTGDFAWRNLVGGPGRAHWVGPRLSAAGPCRAGRQFQSQSDRHRDCCCPDFESRNSKRPRKCSPDEVGVGSFPRFRCHDQPDPGDRSSQSDREIREPAAGYHAADRVRAAAGPGPRGVLGHQGAPYLFSNSSTAASRSSSVSRVGVYRLTIPSRSMKMKVGVLEPP